MPRFYGLCVGNAFDFDMRNVIQPSTAEAKKKDTRADSIIYGQCFQKVAHKRMYKTRVSALFAVSNSLLQSDKIYWCIMTENDLKCVKLTLLQ